MLPCLNKSYLFIYTCIYGKKHRNLMVKVTLLLLKTKQTKEQLYLNKALHKEIICI